MKLAAGRLAYLEASEAEDLWSPWQTIAISDSLSDPAIAPCLVAPFQMQPKGLFFRGMSDWPFLRSDVKAKAQPPSVIFGGLVFMLSEGRFAETALLWPDSVPFVSSATLGVCRRREDRPPG